ncbi:MAG: sigma-70 family RNA polymerase sigma factor [Bacteroidota bacterium]
MQLNSSDIERQLVEACRRGERSAQFRVYQRYAKAMLNTAHRILNDEEEAKDVLQEAFIKVFAKIDTFRFQSTLGAWIKRIVVNTAINAQRKRGIVFDIYSEELERIPAPTSDAGDEAFARKNAAIARNALKELPDGYRAVLSLYLVEGYDHREIAKILGISISTSLSQYNRGKKRLRKIIASMNEDGRTGKILSPPPSGTRRTGTGS